MNILITGAIGYIGSQLVQQLIERNRSMDEPHTIVATDIRDEPNFALEDHIFYEKMDVRSPEIAELMKKYTIDTVVHLATIVTPGKKSNREFEYSVDVGGTENVLKACVESDVNRIVVTSSGAAYGYHADNPEWIDETHPVRGNEEFAYSHHKRLVEELLEDYRHEQPELEQVIFRIGTILGENVNNQITSLFEKKRLLGISGSNSPFVFIWDQDVVACIIRGIEGKTTGIFNVAGDGALTIDQMGEILNKRVIRIPAGVIAGALFFLKRLGLTQYGEEQVNFLRYRPVLDNTRLKEDFGFEPTYMSEEVFRRYIAKNL
ncbi:epimerase [Halalkalibacillus sediminis]|uniref:Epimerase n=1 Tax=Halalkalibacillus sediminis TaxID=2018042 RepID=A0A2I0QU63_9BACI|nr:SDR family oxidoreductase [Halalkalibacillus sediminis]PKR77844.1 epimerase [Halalkalibacillus sediminis]